jgi:hypothetical protein
MLDLIPPMCVGCRHLHAFQSIKDTGTTGTCDAFPAGIPVTIWHSQVDHRHPVDDDQGIQYEPKTPADALYVEHTFPAE